MEEMHESEMDGLFEEPWVRDADNPEESWVRNADNDRLGPIGNIGHFWEVNGAGAEEFSAFHPTRHELITLAKYWTETAIELQYQMFLCWGINGAEAKKCSVSCPTSGVLGSRWSFAWARVRRMRALLGDEIDAAVDQVYRAVGEKKNKKVWDTFLKVLSNWDVWKSLADFSGVGSGDDAILPISPSTPAAG